MMFFTAFSLSLCVTALYDIKTKTIPFVFPVLIFCLPLFKTNWKVDDAILGLLVVGGSLYLPTLIKPRSFGGGDIKLAAACGWALGFRCGLLGIFLSLVFSLIPILWCKIRKYKIEYLPFAPSMAIGFILGAFIF